MTRRPAGTGSLYQPRYKDRHGKARKSRIWWMAWPGAKPQSTGCTDKTQAGIVLRARLHERDRGKIAEPLLTELGDLRRMVENDYIANGRRSLPRVRQAFAQLEAHFGEDRLATKIREDAVTAYVAVRLKAGAKPATVNRELAALRRGFRLAKRARRIEDPPDFSLLSENNTRQGFVEREQIDSILAHLPTDRRPPVLAAYLTGWRMHSELLTRQWRHVDLEARWLRLEPGEDKNRAGRMFPLTDELLALLQKQETAAKDLRSRGRLVPWVFFRTGPKTAGRRITGMRKAWLAACRKAGLPGRLVHDLRRSAVRNLERAQVPKSTAMAMVGLKTDAMHRRYLIVDELMMREAARKLEAKR